MKRLYLVTGASGHLGNTVCRMLLSAEKAVRVLLLEGDRTPLPFLSEVEVVFGDVRDKESLRPLFERPEDTELCVIHCAGIVTIATKFDASVYDVNVTGTKNIVDLCQECGAEKLVYVSSVHVLPKSDGDAPVTETTDIDPACAQGLYAKTKAEATAYVLRAAQDGLNATVVQPSGLIGPFDFGKGNLTQLFIDYYKGALTAAVEGGYDFVDVRDVAAGILAACERGAQGETYLLTGKYCPVSELLEYCASETGKRKVRTVLPMWFARATATLAEGYYKFVRRPPLYTPYSLETLSCRARFSHEKADTELSYRVRPLSETVRDTYRFLKLQNRI